MTHRHTPNTAVKRIFATMALLVMTACSTTGNQALDSSGTPQSGEWSVVAAAAETRAAQFASQANTANGKTSIDFRLRAADNYLLAGRYDLANNQLAQINESALAATNKTRYTTLRSRMQLPPAPRSDGGYSRSEVAARLAQRATQLASNGFNEAAVKLRVLRGGLLETDADISSNDEAIWNLVRRFSQNELATLPVDATDEMVGWWSLGYLQSSRKPEELAASYRWWQQRYPGYAANNSVFAKLTGGDNSNGTIADPTGVQEIVSVDLGAAASNVALLLPVSGRYAPAGKAIEAGFRSADAAAELPLGTIQIIDSISKDVTGAYTDAIINGAQLVIGPLQKPEVAKLAYSGMVSIPVLTLNDPVETPAAASEASGVNAPADPLANAAAGNPNDPLALDPLGDLLGKLTTPELPAGLIIFGLSPEQEAQQVALRAIAEGKTRAAILMPDNDWGVRVGSAFRTAFEQAGGQVIGDGPYTPGTNDLGRDVAKMLGANSRNPLWRDVGSFSSANRSIYEGQERQQRWTAEQNQIDMVFMAAFPRDARILRPSLRFHQAIRLPVYATSHVYSGRPNPRFDADLDGITFCDMPVMLQTNNEEADAAANPNLRRYPPRLVALGRDARLLVDNLALLQTDSSQQLQGATGKLSMVDNRIERQLSCATFEEGNLTPLPAPGESFEVDENALPPADDFEQFQQSL